MKGLIFSIKRYSIHDGPGIRVTFFMKGCPLSCLWCHNPEGISPEPEEIEMSDRIGDRTFIRKEKAGVYYTSEEVVGILDRERIFIDRSSGGVTFSGGEPLYQHEFLLEALRACKSAGYHTTVDTAGHSAASAYKAVIPFTDLFLFDLKHIEDPKHQELTGVSNRLIIDNFRMLCSSGTAIQIRIPVIPGYNDDEQNMSGIRKLICENINRNTMGISLLPYHKTGSSKYGRFGIPNRLNGTDTPSAARMKGLRDFYSSTGLKVSIGG
jgi:pyruvate formate lyase activating enzyme